MDDRRKTAIRKCHPKLRTGITVDNLLPHLHIDARGFLTDVEYATITESSGSNVKQVDQLVDVLLKKEDEDFDYFCAILEKEGYNACSKALKEALHSGDELDVPDVPVESLPIIHDINSAYLEVKRVFVEVCKAQGTPTLEEVKDLCFDLIECAFSHKPQIRCRKDDIEMAKTLPELARVVCFRLSKWISYDFFKKVIARFQPVLRSVEEQLKCYEDQLKPILLTKLTKIAELQQREDVPRTMTELVVKYRLNADGLLVKDLIAQRDFLAQRLGIPEHLLQVLSWGEGSTVVIYWMVRDLLPLAELALCRKNVRAELTRRGVEKVYLNSHPSEHPGPMDRSLQTVHLQRRAVVTVFDAHRHNMDAISLTSDLMSKDILTAEQCQELLSLSDKNKRHEALLYTLLACNKLVECMKLTGTSIAADLQATFKALLKSPDELSVISSYDVSSKKASLPSAKMNFQNTKRSYRDVFAFEFDVLHLEEIITKLRGEFEEQIRHLRTQLNEVDDKVIRMQELSRKEAYREIQIRGRASRVDGWMNDLQEQITIMNGNMVEMQGHAAKMTLQTHSAETETSTLSIRIEEIRERVGATDRAVQEERVKKLKKRIDEQDQVIASLKEELQRGLATLGHIVGGGLPPSGPGAAHKSTGP